MNLKTCLIGPADTYGVWERTFNDKISAMLSSLKEVNLGDTTLEMLPIRHPDDDDFDVLDDPKVAVVRAIQEADLVIVLLTDKSPALGVWAIGYAQAVFNMLEAVSLPKNRMIFGLHRNGGLSKRYQSLHGLDGFDDVGHYDSWLLSKNASVTACAMATIELLARNSDWLPGRLPGTRDWEGRLRKHLIQNSGFPVKQILAELCP